MSRVNCTSFIGLVVVVVAVVAAAAAAVVVVDHSLSLFSIVHDGHRF